MCQTTLPALPTMTKHMSGGSSSNQSSGYIHVTAKGNDSDTEMEDFTSDLDTYNLWSSQKNKIMELKDTKQNKPCRMNLANGPNQQKVSQTWLPWPTPTAFASVASVRIPCQLANFLAVNGDTRAGRICGSVAAEKRRRPY